MNVGNFVYYVMLVGPIAFVASPLLFVAGVALWSLFRGTVRTCYTQRAIRRGAICYRNGDRIVIKHTK